MIKYLLIIINILASCNKISKETAGIEFKMISYESKAYVDENEFPTIKINNNGTFQVFKKSKLIYNGSLKVKEDNSIVFEINGGRKLVGKYINKEKSVIRISRLIYIDVEAKYGDFKKINEIK